MARMWLAILSLSLHCTLLQAGTRSPDPVDPALLAAPTAEHLPTLLGALNGAGCVPQHSEVGDALVKIGKPAVAPLVERLNGTNKWWIQLECVHLLGLMGTDAAEAESVLSRFLVESHHGLPQSYARASLAAVRNDPQGLVALMQTSHSNVVKFALELLEAMGADASPVVPTLRAYAQDETNPRAARFAEFLEKYGARVSLPTGE